MKLNVWLAAITIGIIGSGASARALENAKFDPARGFTGTVAETTNATRYTYVLVDTGGAKVWAAAPRFTVKTGDQVAVSPGAPMRGFESKALRRTFEVVYFTDRIAVAGITSAAPQSLPEAHAILKGLPTSTPTNSLDYRGITKPEGGYTVAEARAQKAQLAGKTVLVRGKVAKYNARIMKRNWIHLRDGTGPEDLTITTTNAVKRGDQVLVRGKLVLDQDFGYGYQYDVLLENAQVTVEPAVKPQ
jgi:hypothetical protein